MSEDNAVTTDDLHTLRERLRTARDSASLHPIGLGEVVSGEGSVRGLADVVQRVGVVKGSAVTVLADLTPKRYADRDVMEVVADVLGPDHQVSLERLAATSSAGIVLADEETVARAIRLVGARRPRGLVSVGSGTITDIAKVVASALSLPHVVVQTAASVNGFADDQSVLLVDGAKRTTPSRWPDALVIDPLVVASAPLGMTRSGLGDQLSMFTAAADWYLATAVGFETSYSPTLVSMMREGAESLLSASARLGRGETDAVSTLADFLTRGGLAMGVAGRTAPSSGLEHAISHLLEMRADATDELVASHGSQVGAASVFAALVWRRVLRHMAEGDVKLLEQNVGSRERVLDAFADLDTTGATARECWRLYQRKSSWIHSHWSNLERVVSDWPKHAREIDQLLGPVDVIVEALRHAQAPVAFYGLSPAPERTTITWAISNAHLMRDRFGILDLADLIGVWSPEDASAVLDEHNELAR